MVNPCVAKWEGIVCKCTTFSGSETSCTAISLALNAHNLTGFIPATIEDLRNLKTLDLSFNLLTGIVPVSIGNLKALEKLYLEVNFMNSTLPDTIGNLGNLTVLDVSQNRFHGAIPSTLDQLMNLTILSLGENFFQEHIPPSISALSYLQEITLAGNFLSGSVPDGLVDKMKDLKVFSLGRNKLTGFLPPLSTDYTPLLREVNFEQNHFEGTIPDSYGNFRFLNSLQIGHNRLVGTIPDSFSNLISLRDFTCSWNSHLSRPLDPVFVDKYNLNSIVGDGNYFSGNAMPSDASIDGLTIFNMYLNELNGTLPAMSFSKSLLYFDVGSNVMSGVLPDWIGSNSKLTYLYLDDNSFYGTIPSQFGANAPVLEGVYMEHNFLTGSIPSTMGQIQFLRELKIHDNELSGTIPNSLASIKTLSTLIMNNNRLTGPLPLFTFKDSLFLETLDVASNRLSGTIPYDTLFEIFALQTVILSDNCFHGSISESICAGSTSLLNLVMNGLGTASGCQHRLFPGVPYFTSFTEAAGVSGTLPQCLFEMKYLASIYFAGDTLMGTLPTVANVSNALQDISLAYNLLSGTLPMWVQGRKSTILDLSNNKLRGTISSEILPLASDDYLALDVNRLSGLVPTNLMNAKNLSVLDGNIYQCNIDRKNLPENDPNRPSYSCGSDAIDRSIYAWMGTAAVALVVRLIIFYWYSKSFIQDERGTKAVVEHSNPLTIAAETNKSEIASILFHLHRSRMYIFNIMREAQTQWNSSTSEKNNLSNKSLNPIESMFLLFSTVRYIFVAILLMTLVLLMPIYGILSIWYSTYEFSYSWSISAILLTGELSTAMLVLGFSTCTILVLYLFHRRVYIFSARKEKDDQERRSSFQRKMRSTRNHADNNGNSFQRSGNIEDVQNRRSSSRRSRSSFISFHTIGRRLSGLSFGSKEMFSADVKSIEGEDDSVEGYKSGANRPSSIVGSNSLLVSDATSHSPRRESGTLSDADDSFAINRTARNKDRWVYRITTTIIALFNFTVMAMIDVLYVMFIIQASTRQTILVQITLSIFKVQWNETILWRLYPTMKIPLERYCRCGQNDKNGMLQKDEHSSGQKTLLDCISEYKFSVDEINFMVFTVLLNNIVIPCIAIAVVSPHCYYNAFFAERPTETISVYTCQLYRFREGGTVRNLDDCLVYDRYQYENTYNAPFYYRYECSAAFSMKFVAVYIFMFIIVGAIMPFLNICLQFLYFYYNPSKCVLTADVIVSNCDDTTAISSQSSCGKYMFYFADFFLPLRWKALTPTPPLSTKKMRLLSNDRLVVRFSSYLAILLAFGVLFPPLALVAVASIYMITYVEQFSISRLLVQAKALNYVWYQEKVLKECEYIAESWFDTLKIILPFASFSYAFVVFDTLGDQYGWKVAVGPSLFIFILPWCFYIWKKLSIWFACQDNIVDLNPGKDEGIISNEDLLFTIFEKFQRLLLRFSRRGDADKVIELKENSSKEDYMHAIKNPMASANINQ